MALGQRVRNGGDYEETVNWATKSEIKMRIKSIIIISLTRHIMYKLLKH